MTWQRGQKSQNEENYIRLGGMYALGFIFVVLCAVLIAVQMNVRYSVRSEQLPMMPREKLVKLKSEMEQAPRQKADTLVLFEDGDEVSAKAMTLIEPVLSQMKQPYDTCEAGELTAGRLKDYDKLVIAVTRYQKFSPFIEEIRKWVKDGGNLMVLYPPEKNGSFESLYDIFGIKDSGYNTYVEAVRFAEGFMIGGKDREFLIEDSYESSREVALDDQCKVYMETAEEYPVPLIWRKNVGKGSVVFDNFGIMEKAYRGIHCACFAMLGDICAYPVINGATFYIDDFPSPVPEGDAKYITRDYNMSIGDFYSQVWWNDVFDMGKRHGIHYTGLVIENYNNQVMGHFERNKETNRFLLFGNMLLESGGEIGIHGYNHMPLVLENFDYQDMYDGYIQWPAATNMKYAINEVFNFTKELFPDEELKVYVPPSNVLSQEGRDVLGSTSIRSIASVYLPADLAYAQEFGISKEDGIINTPRIVSGYQPDEYMYLAAMSELNFHLVSTHFQHPDDVLDEDRGAAEGWENLKSGLESYMDWLYSSDPEIRNLTGSELAAAVQRYDLIGVEREYEDGKLKLHFQQFDREAWMLVRMGSGKRVDSVEGGEAKPLGNCLYLLRADQEEVTINIK